jgi:hypothetical protein
VKHDNKKPSAKTKSSKRNTEDLRCGYPNCTKLFANKYNVKRHIENVHLKMRRRRHHHHHNASSNGNTTNNKTNSSASGTSSSSNSSTNTSLNTTNNNNNSINNNNSTNVSLSGLNLTNGHLSLAGAGKAGLSQIPASSIIALQMPNAAGIMSSPITPKMEPTLASTPNKKHSASSIKQQQQQQQQLQQQQLQSLNAFSSNLNLGANAVSAFFTFFFKLRFE